MEASSTRITTGGAQIEKYPCARGVPNFGHSPAHISSKSENSPTLGRNRRTRPNLPNMWPTVGQAWPKTAQNLSKSAEVGRTKVGRIRPDLVRTWPKSVHMRPKFGRIRFTCGPIWARFGRTPFKLVRRCLKFARHLAKFGQEVRWGMTPACMDLGEISLVSMARRDGSRCGTPGHPRPRTSNKSWIWVVSQTGGSHRCGARRCVERGSGASRSRIRCEDPRALRRKFLGADPPNLAQDRRRAWRKGRAAFLVHAFVRRRRNRPTH